MSSVQTSPIGPATAGRRGTMSAADFAKLAAYPAAPLITAVTTGNGLSLAGGTLALAAAGAGAAGAMTAGAQQIDGAKTLTGGLVLSTVEQPLRISPAAAGGTLYDKPALWFETTGTNQTYMLTMGSGRTSTTWELAIGYYTGALAPVITTRASHLFFQLPSGSGLMPITPNVNDLGVSTNRWRTANVNNVAAVGSVAGTVPLYGKGAAGQSVPFLQIDNSSAVQLCTLDSSGHFNVFFGSVKAGVNVQLNTSGAARPTANAANRGTLWYSKSGAGVADTLEICLKDAADAYAWVQIKP